MVVNVLKRLGIFVAVLVGLCAFYMGYRQLYLSTGWTRPETTGGRFAVSLTAPF